MTHYRRMNIRVYNEKRIAVDILCPATLGTQIISAAMFHSWKSVLQLIERTNHDWQGISSVIHISEAWE